MKLIDCHTHISNEESYQQYLRINKDSKIMALAVFKEYSEFKELPEILKLAEKNKNVFPIGAIDLDKDIKAQLKILERLFLEKKIFGIKIYCGYQYHYMNNEKLIEVAKLCGRFNRPLIFHSGDTYGIKTLLKYAHPMPVDELALKCPNTKIIISHFGFPYLLETAAIVSKNENVYTDISGTITDFNTKDKKKDITNLTKQYIQDLKRIFSYYPNIKNKIMFGTDFVNNKSFLNQILPYINVVKSVFSKDEQASVYYQLAEKLYF